ncbi:MAG: amino acid exporter [Sphingobacteriales bacterium]|jgi:amino acid exporter
MIDHVPFLYGAVFGLILTVVTGPAFFALIRTSIEKGFKAGAMLAFGIFLSDLVYIYLILWGALNIQISDETKMYVGILGGAFLIGLGIYYLLKKVDLKSDKTEISAAKNTGYFFKGLLLNGLNPFVIIYWFSVVSYLKMENDFQRPQLLVFFATVLVTVISVDLLKAKFASYLGEKFGLKLINIMGKIAGIAIVFFGINLIVRSLIAS